MAIHGAQEGDITMTLRSIVSCAWSIMSWCSLIDKSQP